MLKTGSDPALANKLTCLPLTKRKAVESLKGKVSASSKPGFAPGVILAPLGSAL